MTPPMDTVSAKSVFSTIVSPVSENGFSPRSSFVPAPFAVRAALSCRKSAAYAASYASGGKRSPPASAFRTDSISEAAVSASAKNASVSGTQGSKRSTILETAFSAASIESLRDGDEAITLPHFCTLLCGKTTASPAPLRGNTSLTKGTERAASKPDTSLTIPGIEIHARSALASTHGSSYSS